MVFFTIVLLMAWVNPSVANGPPTTDVDNISISVDSPSDQASQLFDICIPVLIVAEDAVFLPVQHADITRLYSLSLSFSYFHPPDAHCLGGTNYNLNDRLLTSHEKGLILALRYY